MNEPSSRSYDIHGEARLERQLRRHVHPAPRGGDRGLVSTVERSALQQQVGGEPALLPPVVSDAHGAEVIALHRQRDAGRDCERDRQELVGIDVSGEQAVVVLEFERELALEGPRLQASGTVLDVQ